MFLSKGWDYVPELWPPTGLLFIPQMVYKSGELQWNDIVRGKLKNLEKNLSTWTSLGMNLGHCGASPVTNHLSHGTALILHILSSLVL
jgi:hypothetical protein